MRVFSLVRGHFAGPRGALSLVGQGLRQILSVERSLGRGSFGGLNGVEPLPLELLPATGNGVERLVQQDLEGGQLLVDVVLGLQPDPGTLLLGLVDDPLALALGGVDDLGARQQPVPLSLRFLDDAFGFLASVGDQLVPVPASSSEPGGSPRVPLPSAEPGAPGTRPGSPRHWTTGEQTSPPRSVPVARRSARSDPSG